MMLAVLLLGLMLGQGGEPAYPINGMVVHSVTGAPLPRVRLTLFATRSSRVMAAATTGDDGKFLMTAVPAGKYRLTAERNGFATQSYGQRRLYSAYSSAVVVGEGLSGESIIFRMVPSAVITGTVIDEMGEGVPGVSLFAIRVTGSGDQRRAALYGRASTDEQGRYRMHSLSAGNYMVAAIGRPWRAMETQGGDEERSGYALTFHPAASEATDAGMVQVEAGKEARADVQMRTVPVVDVTVRVEGAEEEQGLFTSLTVPVFNLEMAIRQPVWVHRGMASLKGTPPGRYQFVLMKGPRVWSRHPVTVEAGKPEFTLGGGLPVRLKVMAEVRGRLAGSQAMLSLRGLDGVFGDSRLLDGKGEVEFPALPAGRYRPTLVSESREAPVLEMRAEGASARGGIVELPATGEARLELIADLRLPNVVGKVYAGEQAQAGILVVLVPKRNPEDELAYRFDQSDSDGSFVWMGVSPGEYLMFAFPDGDADDFRTAAVMRKWLEKGQAVEVRAGMGEVRVEMVRP